MRKEDVVSKNSKVMNGALVFMGTRVPVEILIQHLTAGDSLEDFLEGFPTVTREQAVAYLEMTPEAVDALIQTNTVLQMKDHGIEFRTV